jgi:hypothetical protein
VLPKAGLLLVVAETEYIYLRTIGGNNRKKKLMALWEEILQILHFNSEKGNGQITEPGSLTSLGQRCNDVQTKVGEA